MALRETDPAEGNGYRIEDRLGSCGMGVVHLARSVSGHRLAVKVVHAQHADDEFPTRSRREVAAPTRQRRLHRPRRERRRADPLDGRALHPG